MAFSDLGALKKIDGKQQNSFWSKIITFIFGLFLVTLPFVFTWVNSELFEVPKMLWTYSFTIILVACYCFRMIHEKRFIFKRTFLDIPLLIFVISQILSTIFSIHPRTSLLGYYTRLNGGLFATFTYIALYYVVVNNITLIRIKKILLVVFYACIFNSLWAILEHFGRSFSCLLITSRFDVACWVQDVQSRVFGTFGQPNWLAAYNLTLIPIGLALLGLDNLKKYHKVLIGTSVVALFTAVIFTGSRSGLLAAVAGIIFAIVGTLFIRWWKQPKHQFLEFKNYRSLTIVSVILIVVTLFFGTRYTPSLHEIFTHDPNAEPTTEQRIMPFDEYSEHTVRYDEGGTDSAEIRMIVWRGALRVWQRYPIFGSGVETFAYSYYLDRPMEHNLVSEWAFLYNKAHNEFLNYLATTGLFGFLSYIAIFIALIVKTVPYIWNKKHSINRRLLLVGVLGSTMALGMSNFFGFSTVAVQVMQFTFFALAALIIRNEASGIAKIKTSPASKSTDYKSWQYVLVLATIVTSAMLLINVYDYWRADVYYARGRSLIVRGQSTAGLELIHNAIRRNPREAMFYSDLSDFYAQLAVAHHNAGNTAASHEALQSSLSNLEIAHNLNPVHLNYFRTRTRIFTNLAQIDEMFLEFARDNLRASMALSPTDPQLVYHYALLLNTLGETEASEREMRRALDMRPIYHEVRLYLANLEEDRGNHKEAKMHYQFILDFITLNDHRAVEGVIRNATMSAELSDEENNE
ncbi:MAG: O-antigen ligase family protein [Pseudomonadales bacterium]|nr:O-antigen ligase family protein [Pseudomonadales bacterium]